ncbi:MAG: hypothetical protein ACRDNF_06930 [Streptosporangiaceae bacterium]
MTVLRFPAKDAVGELWWEDDRQPGGWGHQPAIGAVDVPDGTAVQLKVGCDPFDDGPAADLDFIRGLPADSVSELNLTGEFVPASFAAVAHLAPSLRAMSVYIDELGPEAPSVIAELTGLERLSLAGHAHPWDGPSLRLNDQALSAIADLPDLESLSMLGGSYTEHGLQQLRRLPNLAHLHIEREHLTPSIFRFAADMPVLTRLTGLDEFGDEGPMPPAQVEHVRAMLPSHISMD